MSLVAWLGAAALGQSAPTCAPDALRPPPETLSVAWVSRLGKRARGRAWLRVVPTTELRAFATGQAAGNAVRTLQWLGLRRSTRPLKGRYKVVVFDTVATALCRPVASDTLEPVAGVVPCDDAHAVERFTDGCGQGVDRATGAAVVPVYGAQWNTLAVNGFCVLPLDRFVTGP